MRLNDDLEIRTLVHADMLDWVQSPAAGVERRMLFRIGGEKARATTIVRYAAGSRFARHEHSGGEEFIVLEGTFQDETGDFAAGSYVRNPPGTSHAPGSDSGCTILVKLWQFGRNDRTRAVCRPGEGNTLPAQPGVASARLLFDGVSERVVMADWEPGATIEVENRNGLELLVLAGGFDDGTDTLRRWSWLRLPAGMSLRAAVGADGATVWYKEAPLLHADVLPFEDAEL